MDMRPEAFEELLGNGDMTLFDVRTQDEFDRGHLEGATLLSVHDIGFLDAIKGLDRGKKYLVYCQFGGRSGQAAAAMEEEGLDVVNLAGGLDAWEESGRALVR